MPPTTRHGAFVTDAAPAPPLPGVGAVKFVRFTILGNQTPDFASSCPLGDFSGCEFTDLSEIEVYGSATP